MMKYHCLAKNFWATNKTKWRPSKYASRDPKWRKLWKYQPIILLPASGGQMSTQSKENTTDRNPLQRLHPLLWPQATIYISKIPTSCIYYEMRLLWRRNDIR